METLKEWSSDKTNGNNFCKIRNDKGNHTDSESLVNGHTSEEVEAEDTTDKDKGITQEIG